MIMPNTPRKMLVASLIAASMDPLGCGWRTCAALEMPSLAADRLVHAELRLRGRRDVPSHVLSRSGRQLRGAQEMGSYQLVELLGRGGMGEVWRATHRLLARSAAIKLVRPELLGAAATPRRARCGRRFEREAQATAALSSPHTDPSCSTSA